MKNNHKFIFLSNFQTQIYNQKKEIRFFYRNIKKETLFVKEKLYDDKRTDRADGS